MKFNTKTIHGGQEHDPILDPPDLRPEHRRRDLSRPDVLEFLWVLAVLSVYPTGGWSDRSQRVEGWEPLDRGRLSLPMTPRTSEAD